MKRILAAAVLTSVLGLCLCGKDDGQSPQVRSAYELDTLAVRAILDSNALAGVRATGVITMAMVNGVARVTDLSLPGTVTNGGIATLPGSALGSLDCLRYLRLDGNGLTRLPPEIGKLGKLTALLIQNNRITEIPPQIGDLDSLVNMQAGANKLKSLPREIMSMATLKDLGIDGNSICPLSADLDAWVTLRATSGELWRESQDTSACQ